MRYESPIADRVTAVVFFVLGTAMVWGGYSMDRLEHRGIHPASVPGLVPGILGAVLMVCACLLYRGARKRAAPTSASDAPDEGSWRDLAVAGGWSVLYALGFVGSLPFFVATALYLAGFTGWFLWREARSGEGWLTALGVVVFAVATAAGVAALFRYGFLVRLP